MTTSIPFMITRKMRADLVSAGYSEAQISEMTPTQACDVLKPIAPFDPTNRDDLLRRYTEGLRWSLSYLDGKNPEKTMGVGWPEKGITEADKFPPNLNPGVIHCKSGTATLDIDHAAAKTALAAVGIDLDSILADAPYKIVGNPERPPKPVYRVPYGVNLSTKQFKWPDPTGKLLKNGSPALMTIFELRGGDTNSQDVLPPAIHPDTDDVYQWIGGNVPEKPADIPELPASLLFLWLNWNELEPKMKAVCPWIKPTESVKNVTNGNTSYAPNNQNGFDVGMVQQAFNEKYTAADILERNGYSKKRGKKYLAPNSSTGQAGVLLLKDDGNIKSYHGSDVLGDGNPHDAFDCFRILEHDGDRSKAWHAAQKLLGITFVSTNGNGNHKSNGTQQMNNNTQPATAASQKTNQLPQIQVNARPLRDVSGDALAALLERNVPPTVFVRAGVLTRVLVDENKQPGAEAMSVAAVKGELERAANFFRRKITADGVVQDTSCPLPQDYVKDIMALPQWVGIPPLAGIVTAPTFAADKTICIEPGYHQATGLYYHQNGLVLGDTLPTPKNVAEAKELIGDLLTDFPFVDDASKAHAVAILLLPFVRPMIAGATPLHLIDAPTEGTGKGLLADVLTIPFAPNGPALMTAAKSEEEWSKRITAILTTAKSHILIDNIAGKLASETLAAAVTAPFWTDRVLGTNDKMVTLPVKNVWLATANNPSLSAELTSRTVRIRLDAKVERPRHQRTGFRHERLREWARENRGRLATAALVLIRNWIEQFALPGTMQMGSFEDYVAVIGGILNAAEIPGFLGNVVEMYDDLDAERDDWVSFCEQWYTAYNGNSVGITELFPIASVYDPQPGQATISGHDLLSEYLGSGNEKSRKTALGMLLAQHIDRVYGKYRITQAKKKGHAKQYKLCVV